MAFGAEMQTEYAKCKKAKGAKGEMERRGECRMIEMNSSLGSYRLPHLILPSHP